MVDLTEHLRKAGKVKTEKKTLASRATIAGAREAKPKWIELRARYVMALEEAFEALAEQVDAGCKRDDTRRSRAVAAVREIKARIGSRK